MTRIACLFFAMFLGGCLFSTSDEPNNVGADTGGSDSGDGECPGGQLFCADRCTPVAADVDNCGTCGNDCEAAAPSGAHARGCAASVCIFECDAGLADDDGDLQLPDGNGCESDCVPSDEVCDGIDNDCDGETDEELTQTYYLDGDGDGAGNPAAPGEFCPGEPDDGWVRNADDCDDETRDRAPGLDELCDGLDNDCDDEIDEGIFLDYFRDADGDGYGGTDAETSCDGPPPGDWSLEGGDCDDENSAINPGTMEVCDGLDNDCDDATVDATNPDCEQTIFVTSQTYPPDFNLMGGGDAICQMLGASLPGPGNWRAVISTSAESAVDRIRQVGPIRNVQGELMWSAPGMMFSDDPLRPVNMTEGSTMLSLVDLPLAWTGTRNDGSASDRTCLSFMSAAFDQQGTSGNPTSSANWLTASTGTCNGAEHIYCINGQP